MVTSFDPRLRSSSGHDTRIWTNTEMNKHKLEIHGMWWDIHCGIICNIIWLCALVSGVMYQYSSYAGICWYIPVFMMHHCWEIELISVLPKFVTPEPKGAWWNTVWYRNTRQTLAVSLQRELIKRVSSHRNLIRKTGRVFQVTTFKTEVALRQMLVLQ